MSQGQLWQSRLLQASSTTLQGKTIFCAYNLLLDKQVFLDSKQLASLAKAVPKNWKPTLPKKVCDEKTFAEAVVFAFIAGKAAHIPIEADFCNWLEQRFTEHKNRLGGQAGIVSSQLAKLGARAIVYSPLMAEATVKLLDENVLYPLAQKGRIRLVKARGQANRNAKLKVNWIFEFSKGQKIRLGKKTFECKRGNRLILATPFPGIPTFDGKTAKALPTIANQISCLMLAGHHYLQKQYANGKGFDEYVELEGKIIGQLKKANPKLTVHFEYVPFLHKEIERAILEHLDKNIDSLGINEVEIIELCEKIGAKSEARAIRARENALTLYSGALAILRRLNMKRVHLHAPGFHVIVTSKKYSKPPEQIVKAALFSSIAATTKAILGREFAFKELTRSKTEPPSARGLAELQLFSKKYCKAAERTGYCEASDHFALVIPSQFFKQSTATVGLGDVVSSCALLAEQD